jgi:DNA ligase (NAD+)
MLKSLGKFFEKLASKHVQLHETRTCPHCGSRLARDIENDSAEAPWVCPNPDCPPQLLKRVALWASAEAMDIAGCDEVVVTKLVATGLVHDAPEFYGLKVSEIAALDGMDAARARELWNAIDASRKREAWRVLVGLGISGIGKIEAQIFCAHFKSLEDLFGVGRERLARLDDVTETMARNLTRWYSDPVNRRVVRRLERAGVNFDTRR